MAKGKVEFKPARNGEIKVVTVRQGVNYSAKIITLGAQGLNRLSQIKENTEEGK